MSDLDLNHKKASRSLIEFISEYSVLLENQIILIRDVLQETVDGVMNGIMEISAKTEERKKQADEMLEKTFSDPDQSQKETITAVQKSATRVFEEARGMLGGKNSQNNPGGDPSDLEEKLRHSTSLLSKQIESMGSLDEELKEYMFMIMGKLSADDVIAQRLSHLIDCLHATTASLGYVLVDYPNRCNAEQIEKFRSDLLAFTYNTYSMDEERKCFKKLFPEETGVKKAS